MAWERFTKARQFCLGRAACSGGLGITAIYFLSLYNYNKLVAQEQPILGSYVETPYWFIQNLFRLKGGWHLQLCIYLPAYLKLLLPLVQLGLSRSLVRLVTPAREPRDHSSKHFSDGDNSEQIRTKWILVILRPKYKESLIRFQLIILRLLVWLEIDWRDGKWGWASRDGQRPGKKEWSGDRRPASRVWVLLC